MNKYVCIEWIDVTKQLNDDSFDESVQLEDLVCHMKTVGVVHEETDLLLLLVQEYNGDKPRDWVIIPKSLITKRTVMRKK